MLARDTRWAGNGGIFLHLANEAPAKIRAAAHQKGGGVARDEHDASRNANDASHRKSGGRAQDRKR